MEPKTPKYQDPSFSNPQPKAVNQPPQPVMPQPAPQVISPTPPAPIPQTVAFAAPVAQPVAPVGNFNSQPPVAPRFEYSSNPFKAVSKGLGRALTINPISSLTVGLLAIIALFFGGILCSILVVILPGATRAIGILLVVVLLILMVFRALAGSTQVHDKSMSDETITGRQALGSASKRGYWRFVGATLLSGLFTLLASFVLIIPGLIVGSRLSLVPFIVYSENLGVMAAIKRSWHLTKGHTWEMLGVLWAGAIVIGSSGGLLSFIGGQAGLANRYYELKDAENKGVSTGKTHWLNFFTPIVTVLLIVAYVGGLTLITKNATHKVTTLTDPYNSKISPTIVGNSYCYFSSSSASAKDDCVSKSACQANSDCSAIYFGGSTDSTNSGRLTQ